MKLLLALRMMTLGLLAVAVGLAAFLFWREQSVQLDDYGSIGSFTLTGINGQQFTEADLNGKISVVACFFTCCTTSCPVLNREMAKLQEALSDLADVRLISLTVDPEADTPQKLKAYAESFGAKPDRWIFLTGDRGKIEEIVRNRLKQGLEKNPSPNVDPGNKFDHSERLTVIDRNGRIRGWFSGTTPEGIEDLKKAVRYLHE